MELRGQRAREVDFSGSPPAHRVQAFIGVFASMIATVHGGCLSPDPLDVR